MKTTVVPAQVTTVEDKIAGNLSFSQLLLMTAPVFVSGVVFAFVPPFMQLRSYKVVVCAILTLVCLLMAIRIKDKILIQWLAIITRYNVRPRYYLFNKNDLFARSSLERLPTSEPNPTPVKTSSEHDEKLPLLAMPEIVRLEAVMAHPDADFHVRVKRGGLEVYVKEIK
jgi:PrgI family protein